MNSRNDRLQLLVKQLLTDAMTPPLLIALSFMGEEVAFTSQFQISDKLSYPGLGKVLVDNQNDYGFYDRIILSCH